jgi:hypothetical protein
VSKYLRPELRNSNYVRVCCWLSSIVSFHEKEDKETEKANQSPSGV